MIHRNRLQYFLANRKSVSVDKGGSCELGLASDFPGGVILQ